MLKFIHKDASNKSYNITQYESYDLYDAPSGVYRVYDIESSTCINGNIRIVVVDDKTILCIDLADEVIETFSRESWADDVFVKVDECMLIRFINQTIQE